MNRASPGRTTLLLSLFALAVVGGAARAADQAPAKATIALPSDAAAVVISYDPGAAGFVRKGAAPYLAIRGGGGVTVTNLFDGSKKETSLTPDQLQELLGFIVRDNDFLNLTQARIDDGIKAAQGNGPFMALGDVGTSVIKVQTKDLTHEVSFRGAEAFFKIYPKVVPLAQYAAIEKKLNDFAAATKREK